ncbi:hypothetical protein [Glutamicibacter ardleyensis]|uniref:hypothetical protein n=1 Tax=Glutamicibacter ardleyensis TaxID=225894 RepID=UPI003FD5FBE8
MTYRIEESPLGTYALYLNQQLIMQATSRAECVRVRDVLQDRGHAEWVLSNTYYDRDTNEIRDGIQPR